jgi:hypothetical protein
LDVYEWRWPFAGLSVPDRLTNEDSFVAFVRTNYHPWTAPLESPIGFGVGFSLLAPGSELGVGRVGHGGGPALSRYLVTIEVDPTLYRRLFRFTDLHLGLRADFDTSGSLIASATLGSRIFAPVSVSPQLPLYLDLRAGYALGGLSEVESLEGVRMNPEISGPVGEARIGFLSGHWGGSVGYRNIISLVENVPNLHQFTIAGEIRFP